jgi:hypothetical protein
MDKEILKECIPLHIERTLMHIAFVNKFADVIGQCYSQHDADKLDANRLLYGYVVIHAVKNLGYPATPENKALMDETTLLHVCGNQHHPECWSGQSVKSFDRDTGEGNPPLDVSGMPFESIQEMCCDWCAMSQEFGNSPFDWYDKVRDTRWLFSKKQDTQIREVLGQLWGK